MSDTAGRCLVDTRDVDEARTLIGASYCDHAIHLRDAARGFHAVQTETTLGALAVHRLKYGSALEVSASPLRNAVLVSTPVRGRLTVTIGPARRELAAGDVVAIGPDREFSLSWSEDCQLSTVRLSRALVESAAREVGQPAASELDFDLVHRPPATDTARWNGLVAFLEADARSDHPLAGSPVLTRRIEDLVAGTVVRSLRLTTSPRPEEPAATPRHVRRAVERIHADAALPLDLAGLAAAVGVSPRALQSGFRRHLGTSPMRLLRDVRLHRAHADLWEADPSSGHTVAEIAYNWGFGNLGRFARDYRTTFGELPSETLRR